MMKYFDVIIKQKVIIATISTFFILGLLYFVKINDYDSNKYLQISCGYWHSLKLDRDGSVWAWGANWYGQLGNKSTTDSKIPIKVLNLKDVKSISSGSFHNLALTKDGSVWSWGANIYGQLGINSDDSLSTCPVKILGLRDVVAISCGDSHSLALTSDGNVWAWGLNFKGQLGDGTILDSKIPVKVKGLSDIKSVYAGKCYSLAIPRSGTVYRWGLNLEKYADAKSYSSLPKEIPELKNIKYIACGSNHCLALSIDGDVWGWGSNGNGQLGIEDANLNNSYSNIDSLNNIVSIACGDSHSVALKSDGTVWVWGGGTYLGNRDFTATIHPTRIKILENIKEVSSNYNHFLVLDVNNQVWSWGKNWKGQVGDGTTIDKKLPIQIFNSSTISRKYSNSLKEIKSPLKSNGLHYDDYTYLNLMEEDGFSKQGGLYNNQHLAYDINVLPVWSITLGESQNPVGILDTGIDVNHEDLKNSIYINLNEIPNNGVDDDRNGFIDDVNGWDFVNNDNSVFDSKVLDSHGTKISGIIAAEKNGKGIVGVAPNAKVIPLKFINGDISMVTDVVKAIEYAQTQGVEIMNCSWGWKGIKYNSILYNSMRDQNMLFVCSAGNKISNKKSMSVFPASFDLPNIISVSSINNFGILDPNSNYGNMIDVAAPGVNIFTTIPDNEYNFFSGTSIATSFVTGEAQLIKSYIPEIKPEQLAKRISEGITYMNELKGKLKTSGLINVHKAIHKR